ncbi:hypothetical protein I6N95_15085 [Vagococcus sp. BWB3-3]|uniref:Uncharacterized protein n=1 Tax=Vagococcus allomyrinae TaxID=2794353 RepID=A0A940SXG3_9ENTE|nr:hypothetical protein [Vagococcus allomyrinae]MBP1042343.1 hypothetical protein [Vagococcus allomyrinae]
MTHRQGASPRLLALIDCFKEDLLEAERRSKEEPIEACQLLIHNSRSFLTQLSDALYQNQDHN